MINDRYHVVVEVKGVQVYQLVQVLYLLNQIVLQIKTAQFRLTLQPLNPLYTVVLQPQTLHSGVLLQILYLIDSWIRYKRYTLPKQLEINATHCQNN